LKELPAMSPVEGPVPTETGTTHSDTPEKTESSHEQSHDSYTSPSAYDQDLDAFAGMDESCMLGEATVLIMKQTKEKGTMLAPPALPQKSSLRASRLLDNLNLTSIESATQSLTAPHDMYLSSEEDASSSAAEFSEYDWDSDDESTGEEAHKTHARKKSHEDTARVVSVIYSGKPCIVDLPSPRRLTSPSSPLSSTSTGESTRDTLYGTPPESPLSEETQPEQQSSADSTPQSSPPALFLNTDPFADNNYSLQLANPEQQDSAAPRTAEAPTSIYNQMQKTFNLVKKRSRPALRTLNSAAMASKGSISSASMLSLVPSSEPQTAAKTAALSPPSPVRYNDIIRAARQNSTLTAPTTPTTPTARSPAASSPGSSFTSKKLLRGLGLGGKRHSLRTS
jgi:hypothetical protein